MGWLLFRPLAYVHIRTGSAIDPVAQALTLVGGGR